MESVEALLVSRRCSLAANLRTISLLFGYCGWKLYCRSDDDDGEIAKSQICRQPYSFHATRLLLRTRELI